MWYKVKQTKRQEYFLAFSSLSGIAILDEFLTKKILDESTTEAREAGKACFCCWLKRLSWLSRTIIYLFVT